MGQEAWTATMVMMGIIQITVVPISLDQTSVEKVIEVGMPATNSLGIYSKRARVLILFWLMAVKAAKAVLEAQAGKGEGEAKEVRALTEKIVHVHRADRVMVAMVATADREVKEGKVEPVEKAVIPATEDL
jgi:hypothetical protein